MSPSSNANERRVARRESVRIEIRLYDEMDRINLVSLSDFSLHGFRFQGQRDHFIGERVSVELPRLGRRAARIIWAKGDEIGVRFDQSLAPTEFFAAATGPS